MSSLTYGVWSTILPGCADSGPQYTELVTTLPSPAVPWQLTGNHWLVLPCIHPADASIRAIGMLHRGARAAIEFAGSEDFLGGAGEPLLGLSLEVGGVRHHLASAPIAWERALGWIPTFTCTVAGLIVRGTVFAPYGRDADVPGAVYALAVENRTSAPVDVVVSMSGTFGHWQTRVRTRDRSMIHCACPCATNPSS